MRCLEVPQARELPAIMGLKCFSPMPGPEESRLAGMEVHNARLERVLTNLAHKDFRLLVKFVKLSGNLHP